MLDLRRWCIVPVAAAFVALTAGPAFTQGMVNTPRVHALTGARVVTGPGSIIELGTVVVRDGLIEAVGADVSIPADARVWELDSLTVYPGLIDLAMGVSAPETKEDDAVGDLGHPVSGVRADLVLADALPLSETDRKARRAAGFTTLRVLPKDGIFRGQAAIVNLGDGDLGANLLARRAGQVAAFATSGNIYPGSIMGAVAVMRQAFADSRWYDSAGRVYEKSPRGVKRPDYNAAFAALAPVVRHEEPVLFMTDDVLDLLRADGIAREFGLSFEYVGSGEEYKRLAEVRAITDHLVVPVNFPKAPSVGSGGAAYDVTTEALRHWDAAPSNPAKIHEAGIEIALSATGMKDVSAFRTNVAKAIEAGLPAETALAACTTVPARRAGLADRLGRVERGMIANLVITDGDLFDEETKIREVWVDGARYEIEVIEPPKGDPRGTWSTIATDGAGNEYPGTLEVTGEIGALKGTVTAMGREFEAKVTQSGSTLIVSYTLSMGGQGAAIKYTAKIEGDSGSGSGTSPFGGFSMSMTRTSKPSFNRETGR